MTTLLEQVEAMPPGTTRMQLRRISEVMPAARHIERVGCQGIVVGAGLNTAKIAGPREKWLLRTGFQTDQVWRGKELKVDLEGDGHVELTTVVNPDKTKII